MTNGMTDWELVVACLSPTQATISVSRDVDFHARLLCDGLGKLERHDFRLWGWSHVGDSSDAALARCAIYLRKVTG